MIKAKAGVQSHSSAKRKGRNAFQRSGHSGCALKVSELGQVVKDVLTLQSDIFMMKQKYF